MKSFMLLPVGILILASVGCGSTGSHRASGVLPYTSEDCIVMGSRLGSMGDPIVRVYEGQEVKFCCEPCIEEFEEDPAFYLEQLRKGAK